MTPSKKNKAEPKSYIYVPGNARLNPGAIESGPPTTIYEKRKVILRRDDVVKQVTKRRTEPDAESDS